MKNKFFIFVIIIILIIGIYFVVKKPSAQPADNQRQTEEQTQIENFENSPAKDVQSGVEKMTNSESSSSAEEISKTIVNYTDNGFSPSSLEIKMGQTVQFVNQSRGGMWVASAPHPSHTDYPEFDAKKNIPSGGIYKFTFMEPGEWKYHNHISPGKFGSIIVQRSWPYGMEE